MLRILLIVLVACAAVQTSANADDFEGDVVMIESKGGSSVTIERPTIKTIAGQSFVGGRVLSAKSNAGNPENVGNRIWIASTEITRIVEFGTKSQPSNQQSMQGRNRTAPSERSEADQQSQETVMVEWRNTWYPAKILKTENGKSFIHYEGYGSNWDEWVTPNRIRAGTSDRTGTDQLDQESVMVEWRNQWFPARIVKTENGKSFIHYDGYGSNWDEWVTPDRIKQK